MFDTARDYPDTQLLIGGQWKASKEGEQLAVVNPANEQEIGRVAKAGVADLAEAADAANAGFKVWRAISALERAKIMQKAANLLRDRAESIAYIMTAEQGKPVAQALAETRGAADTLDWFAEEGKRVYGQIVPPRDSAVMQLVTRAPVGPVAAFTPWNFPLNQSVRKISIALAAGCSIVLKGPEETPASVAALVQCYLDAGVPEGVLNLVFGTPAEISEYLISHPAIRKVSFTGSTAVGKHLASLAGKHMKRNTMELGGHAPTIICEDADLESAAQQVAGGKYRNAGQVCISPTRILVHRSIGEEYVARFVEESKSVAIGDGMDEATQLGPLAHDRRPGAVHALIEDAVNQGAELHLGGQPLDQKGYFYPPTILSAATPAMRIMNEEPFGPVAIFTMFDDLDEAIAEANRLSYGLASYAFTRSLANASRLSNEIEAGMLSINHLGLSLPETPFGGIKDSGYGVEGGSEAISAYLDTRFVTMRMQ